MCQFEDYIDVAKTLHPQYEFMFMFDHSCGHDRKRPDGLNATRIQKNFGGKQPKMRDTTINCGEQLGEFGPTISIGDTQTMMFTTNNDVGPFYLSPNKIMQQRYDKPTGEKVKEFKRKEKLVEALQEKALSGKGTLQQIRTGALIMELQYMMWSTRSWKGG
jgi:hypothetical protein